MALIASTTILVRSIINPVKPFCTPNLGSMLPILSSSISGKAYRESNQRPPPFPYKEKNYTVFRSWLDKTTSRFDENSKIIVVDGPIACGKTQFAKALAEELDMLHMPEATMDMYYINSYGYDMRKLDDQLPEVVQSFDEKKFCENPFHRNVAGFQLWKYRLRFSQYVDALAHLLSTGQGIVLERSPWSDFVFVEAMRSQKYITKEAKRAYYEIKEATIKQLMMPHLIIYLDVPAVCVTDKIKARGHKHEINSKALTLPFLEKMESVYKEDYLRQIMDDSELLMYNWTEPGDVEAVVEDIERIDFDKHTKHDTKLRDWRKAKEQNWADARMKYADRKHWLMSLFNVPLLYAEELLVDGEAVKAWTEAWTRAPGSEYEEGFNPHMGDTNLLFKTRMSKYVPY